MKFNIDFNFTDDDIKHFHNKFAIAREYEHDFENRVFTNDLMIESHKAFKILESNPELLTEEQLYLMKFSSYHEMTRDARTYVEDYTREDLKVSLIMLQTHGFSDLEAIEIYRKSINSYGFFSGEQVTYKKVLDELQQKLLEKIKTEEAEKESAILQQNYQKNQLKSEKIKEEEKEDEKTFMEIIRPFKNVLDTALTLTFEYPKKYFNKIYIDKNYRKDENNYTKFDTFVNYIIPLLTLIFLSIWVFNVINGFPASGFFYTSMVLVSISFIRYKTLNFQNRFYLKGVWKHLSQLRLSAYETKHYLIAFEQHMTEFQEQLHVNFDTHRGYELSVDEDFGVIISMYIDKNKSVSINSLNDELLTYFKVVPFLNPLNDSKALLVHDRKVSFMLYEIFLKQINSDNEIQYLFAEKPEFFSAFKELSSMKRELEEQKKLEAIEYKNKLELIKIQALNLSEKATNILSLVRKNKGNWGFNYWNLTTDAITENDNFLRFRCKFLDNTTFNNIKNSKERLESAFRLPIQLKKLSDRGSFEMYILKESEIKPFSLKMSDVDSQNALNKVFLGKTLTGDLVYDWNHQANHFIVSGVSGSGKSVAIRAILAQLVQLTDFDYRELYLTSSSKVADFVDFEKKGAFLSSGVEKQAKVFDYILNKLEKREELFYEKGVDSIKSYNEKYPENPLGQLILVADEWENSRNNLDSKLAKKLEGTLVAILNIARSSGAVVMVGSQSILKSDIGTIADKMTIRISGTNKRNVLNQIDTEIADYYSTLTKKAQGVFFIEATNLEAENAQLTHGSTTFTLTQTPFISDISSNLPVLRGSENSSTILSDGEDENVEEISIINEFKEDFEIENSTIDI